VGLDERVQAERLGLREQADARRVVEVAQQEQDGVGPGLLRRAQVVRT
jgi:hypothetical protein